MKHNPGRKNYIRCGTTAAFTLVEMLLVIVILAILAGIVYPNVSRRAEDGRKTAARAQLAAFRTAIGTFEVDNGFYPRGQNGLQELMQPPADAPNWHGPYLDKFPKDPWGNDYLYSCSGRNNPSSYDLLSPGPDGAAGTEDDITNW